MSDFTHYNEILASHTPNIGRGLMNGQFSYLYDSIITASTLNSTTNILTLKSKNLTLHTDFSSLSGVSANNYLTGQTLSGTNLVSYINNGDVITTDLSSLSGGTSGDCSYTSTLSFSAGEPQTISHNLNETNVLVQIRNSAGELIIPDSVNNYFNNSLDIEVSEAEAHTVTILKCGGGGSSATGSSMYWNAGTGVGAIQTIANQESKGKSSGTGSIAQGSEAEAKGDYSFASGNKTKANGKIGFVHSYHTGATNYVINDANYGAILGGQNGLLTSNATNSILLGGANLTGTSANTVYVPFLNVHNLNTGTGVSDLAIDSAGNIIKAISNVSFGHTFFVSPEGDDITGQMGNINRPFKTLPAAITSAVTSTFEDSLIYVWPGTYIANEIQYDKGNFYFTPGAIVQNHYYTGTDDNWIFKVGSYTPTHTEHIIYTASTLNIYGSGSFYGVSDSTSASWSQPISLVGDGKMYLECNSIELSAGTGIHLVGNSRLIANVNTITSTDGGYLISVRNHATLTLEANTLHVKEPVSVGVNTTIGIQIGSGFATSNPSQSNINVHTLIWDIPLGVPDAPAPLLIDSLSTGNKLIVNIDTIESAGKGMMIGSVSGGEALIDINKIESIGYPIQIDGAQSKFISINTDNIVTESNFYINNSENIYINANNSFSTLGNNISTITNSNVVFNGNFYSISGNGFYIQDTISNVIFDNVYVEASGYTVNSVSSNTHVSILQSLNTNKEVSSNIIINSKTHNYLDKTRVQELNINNLNTGTSISNLGIDNNGNVVTGDRDPVYWTSGATGMNSIKTVEGGNVSTGDFSIAHGSGTSAIGYNACAQGKDTTAGGDVVSTTMLSFAGATYASGGTFSGTTTIPFDDANVYLTATILGNKCLNGNGNVAFINGSDFVLTGYTVDQPTCIPLEGRFYYIGKTKNDFASGLNTQAIGGNSVSQGDSTIASGDTSHAQGKDTTAYGSNSHAQGNSTTASGDASHAQGKDTTAYGSNSHTQGLGTTAYANCHAEGKITEAGLSSEIANRISSHSEGFYTKAYGEFGSHAEGRNTISNGGNGSHAQGYSTIASGRSSHAQGLGNTASTDASHAGGYYSIVTGRYSFIHSHGSVLSGENSVLLGGRNLTGTSDDTVYVPFLNVHNLYSATSLNNVGFDGDGNIVTGTSVSGLSINSANVLSIEMANHNNYTTSLNYLVDTNTYVTGGTYNASAGTITYKTNSGNTFTVSGVTSGMTDTFVTGGTLTNGSLLLRKSNGINTSAIDLSALQANYYVTGGTLSGTNLTLHKNDGVNTSFIDLSSLNVTETVTGATNGITIVDKNVELGGTLTKNTEIELSANSLSISANTNPVLLVNSAVTVSNLNINNVGSGTSIFNLGLDANNNVVTGTTGGGGSSIVQENFTIEFISGNTYDIITYNFVAGTINEARLILDDGSADVTISINGTAITGMNAAGITDSMTTLTATAANTLTIGARLTIKLENVTDALSVSGSIKITQ